MPQDNLLERIVDQEARANPYPLLRELQAQPVQPHMGELSDNEIYIVTKYKDVAALLQDPRLSSEKPVADAAAEAEPEKTEEPFFSERDNPEHDEQRGRVMSHFGPPHRAGYIDSLSLKIEEFANNLIDKMDGEPEFDVIEKFAYPLPVFVICHILGVPMEDEPKFHELSQAALSDVPRKAPTEEQQKASQALAEYIGALVEKRRKEPGEDLISGMVHAKNSKSRMKTSFIVQSAVALLVAGHETTVNLIGNGVLTLLRHPGILERLRKEPELAIGTVEEILRYEPPAQFVTGRIAVEDIEVDGITIPKGSEVGFAIAAANRDPDRFTNPDKFDPDRTDNAHLGFGSGYHYCFGAPLARLEGQIALRVFAKRVMAPELVQDPPLYRPSPLLRGPRSLRVRIAAIEPA